ncbi:hypothetical protein PMI16_02169 [Herbaspirillum sp. CF444]|uniref:hypothetical protein n=1 Tax=Herbaspirillum sp. CF444 TaxID=1144319 RepID=UPI0002726E73|nr:hypothetical protein [Herbaspirillum sp. CF444]EJL88525.1 hypothetical protein PMI16_02169 [Herbaspirillum sp. CF444]
MDIAANSISFRHYSEKLEEWEHECKRRLTLRLPSLIFDSDIWHLRSTFSENFPDFHFSTPLSDFSGKDKSFEKVIRCLATEELLASKNHIEKYIRTFRYLNRCNSNAIWEINLADIWRLEDMFIEDALADPIKASPLQSALYTLQRQITLLGERGVMPSLGYRLRTATRSHLNKIFSEYNKKSKKERFENIDRKFEALNDAFNAVVNNDSRLSNSERIAVAACMRLLCAPSRINELGCSSIHDHIVLEDYTQRSTDEAGQDLDLVHQLLLINMKGSKGTQWGPKPGLSFMIDVFNYSTRLIIECGKNSRMLVEWYEANPNKLYLPQNLEHLRGTLISVTDLSMIIFNREDKASHSPHLIFERNKTHVVRRQNPRTHNKVGRPTCMKEINFIPFEVAEKDLLQQVHRALKKCREFSRFVTYKGKLSHMLVLCDREDMPCIPWALDYRTIRRRLKETVFKKLGITMPVNGVSQYAELDAHDPRRWLTTQALIHGEGLSDAILNKWANRSSMSQIRSYDGRTESELASFGSMPNPTELEDLSRGIEKTKKLAERYSTHSEFITAADANISVTSMERVMTAIEDRPIARVSEQIIILYPQWYGICLHQHHEIACTNYDSCAPCNNNIVTKGHLPTNERLRKRAIMIQKSVAVQLERLIREHNRQIADEPDAFANHILLLAEKGLSTDELADSLIDDFHALRDLLKDKLLAKRLEEAFVTRGFVKIFDDEFVPSGALIRYNNPSYNATPGLEMAIQANGGREKIAETEKWLISKYPQFAPTAAPLHDERSKLNNGDEDDDSVNND